MKPNDAWIERRTKEVYGINSAIFAKANAHVIRSLIATITEEHCKAIEIAAEKRSSYDLAAQNMALESIDAIRSWAGKEDNQ